MKQRYCFFNVDGLLNKSSEWKRSFTIDYELTSQFCRFLVKNNLIPVMASSWRFGFIKPGDDGNAANIKEIESIFDLYGLKIYGKTPFLKGRPRDKEIERFLYFHEKRDYIVLDGDPDEYENVNSNIYFIDPETGFTKKDAKNAGKLLKKWDRVSA